MRIPIFISSVVVLLHFVLNALGQYGYFRDELYYIISTRHLDWGFIDHPPLSIAILAVNRFILGDSLFALRFLPALLNGAIVLGTAFLAREFGGSRTAQTFAALAAATTPLFLATTGFYSMNAWDVVFWIVCVLLVARIVREERPWHWPALGIAIGLGMQNKYSVGFLCAGLVAGFLLTPQRSFFKHRGFWLAVAIAGILFAPHVIWQVANGFPSLEFMHNARYHKNLPVSPLEYLIGMMIELGPVNVIIWIAGLGLLLFSRDHRPFRLFGIAFLFVVAVFMSQQGKVYYSGPAFPILFAAGGVAIELFSERRRWIRPVLATLMTATAAFAPLALPIQPVQAFLEYSRALGFTAPQQERGARPPLPQHFADQFGWKEKVAAVARAYQRLTPGEQADCLIFADNYGRAAAIDFFGPEFGLPPASSSHNSYWMWGPGTRKGSVVIILGGNQEDHEKGFTEVGAEEEIVCDSCMPFENHLKVYVCRGPKIPIAEMWPSLKEFI